MLKKSLFLAILAILIVSATGCCGHKGGQWTIAGVRSSIAGYQNAVVVINNHTDLALEVRLNGSPVVAQNAATKETKIAYIPPRGSASQGFRAFLQYYSVSMAVAGHCTENSPANCADGGMASRQFYVSADGAYQQTYTWDIYPGMLR
jgi:hypothetical protein